MEISVENVNILHGSKQHALPLQHSASVTAPLTIDVYSLVSVLNVNMDTNLTNLAQVITDGSVTIYSIIVIFCFSSLQSI